MTNQPVHGDRGDERIRTAELGGTIDSAYELGNRLACLADGEGHFSIEKRPSRRKGGGYVYQCAFIVQARDDDAEWLELFQKRTGLGKVYRVAARPTLGRRNNPKARWSVHRKGDCRELVRIFDRFPLWSRKAVEYEVWRLFVLRWNGPFVVSERSWESAFQHIRNLRRYVPREAA